MLSSPSASMFLFWQWWAHPRISLLDCKTKWTTFLLKKGICTYLLAQELCKFHKNNSLKIPPIECLCMKLLQKEKVFWFLFCPFQSSFVNFQGLQISRSLWRLKMNRKMSYKKLQVHLHQLMFLLHF